MPKLWIVLLHTLSKLFSFIIHSFIAEKDQSPAVPLPGLPSSPWSKKSEHLWADDFSSQKHYADFELAKMAQPLILMSKYFCQLWWLVKALKMEEWKVTVKVSFPRAVVVV